MAAPETSPPPLRALVHEWGRIGVVGFGGPPAHITLLREAVVDRRRWVSEPEFEDGLAVVNLLPAPRPHNSPCTRPGERAGRRVRSSVA